MVDPAYFAQYTGFTEDEVRTLCEHYHMEFSKMEQWYDGYSFDNVNHIYSPNSVMSAIRMKKFGNYRTKTESYESLKKYISINIDGLKDAVIAMLGGQKIEVETLAGNDKFVAESLNIFIGG